MITKDRLAEHFHPVVDIGHGLVRCSDELPKRSIYTYFKLASPEGATPFLVSNNLIDDTFAELVLSQARFRAVDSLCKEPLAPNPYGFTHLLFAPHRYHSELKGRLDADRPLTTLCIPIFNSEFSGVETPEQIYELRRNVVPTYEWSRDVCPQISLRFDNPKTGGGTGDKYVLCKLDLVLNEIENLIGADEGFIEILNYKSEAVELLFSQGKLFTWIADRNDEAAEVVPQDALQPRLWNFLTR